MAEVPEVLAAPLQASDSDDLPPRPFLVAYTMLNHHPRRLIPDHTRTPRVMRHTTTNIQYGATASPYALPDAMAHSPARHHPSHTRPVARPEPPAAGAACCAGIHRRRPAHYGHRSPAQPYFSARNPCPPCTATRV
ncbi:hypothetical protein B0H19DRAFT_1252366 [Mycena capillaripes]|nr:hypothetical protein B0H19DRAFT_1252366 [Mycena capillaripes]